MLHLELLCQWWRALSLAPFSINGLLLCGLVALLITIAAVILLSCHSKSKPEPQSITLQQLSELWTKAEEDSGDQAQSSPPERKTEPAVTAATVPQLRHPRAAAFFDQQVRNAPWFSQDPPQQAVCTAILELLDREGNCPSVVTAAADVEGSWDKNTFRLLSRTTLLDHTLNVAEKAVRLLREADACHVIPDTLVAALAHDLGKLKRLHGTLYSLGEHPLAAGSALAGIQGFAELAKKEEILRAVKLHHKTTDGLLAKTLKKADQLARQQELEANAAGLATGPEATAQAAPAAPAGPAPEPAMPPQECSVDAAAARKARADIFGEETCTKEKTNEVPAQMDISAWFDTEAFLHDLKPYINRMFGRRFLAFSMPDGHVYFQVKVLEEVARKQAERAGAMEVAAMASDDTAMRRVLLSVVNRLRAEPEIIARGLIKETFFGGYFTVTRKSGRPIKGYYTPFHAEPFGSIGELERAKSEQLRDLQAVQPLTESVT